MERESNQKDGEVKDRERERERWGGGGVEVREECMHAETI